MVTWEEANDAAVGVVKDIEDSRPSRIVDSLDVLDLRMKEGLDPKVALIAAFTMGYKQRAIERTLKDIVAVLMHASEVPDGQGET